MEPPGSLHVGWWQCCGTVTPGQPHSGYKGKVVGVVARNKTAGGEREQRTNKGTINRKR